ncbi:MAG: DNA repair protein RecN [Thermodesulfobacteriota bacterium]|nr:DNA repair protein RecN [Thermodesulfobacteriota bacterium]
MLTELNIKNFAIIDELEISFRRGLNVITGETGAGKSIIIGAVGLLLGERASSDLIRSSEETAMVEALFDISDKEQLKEKLMSSGFYEGDELVVKRIVARSGKNRVYINGNLATLNMLSTLAESLVNISGQHEHQTILNAENHIDILDEFGGLLSLRSEFANLYDEYQNLKSRLNELESVNSESGKREEFLRFQLKEIEDAGITIGEDLSLSKEKNILNNAKRLVEYAAESYETLYDKGGSILEELGGTINNIKEIKKIDLDLKVSEQELDSMFFSLEDISFTLRDYVKDISFDPERLEEIEDRLEYLGRLKRKYGSTLEDVLGTKKGIEEKLKNISSLDEDIKRLSEQIFSKKTLLLEKGKLLSQRRHEAAVVLKEALEDEIHALGMANAEFQVTFDESVKDKICSKGLDEIEFYLSTNVGEELKPLNRIASGGELSRIVLSMKKVLAGTGAVDTIIFDEVDSGIGGAMAGIVGRKLKGVSKRHQVICITHLPQIACFGDSHYLVSKKISGERTNTHVSVLSESERLGEITRMLGGLKITEKTREHAREMLKASRS